MSILDLDPSMSAEDINLLVGEGMRSKELSPQRAKKVVSDSPGLVDFAIGLVNSVLNLPDGQVMFFEKFE